MGIGRFVEYKETRNDEGSIRPPIIVAYRPLSFPVKNGRLNMYLTAYHKPPA